MVTRFAPSPTGLLHTGHAMAAWVAHELARRNGGTFLLRHEDIDRTRVREEFYRTIEQDLNWLELQWHGVPLRQTGRAADYETAFEILHSLGVAYPCFCTRREVHAAAGRQTTRPAPSMAGPSITIISQELSAPQGALEPIYPGTCRQLPEAITKHFLASHKPHCWRLNSAKAAQLTGSLAFHDLLHGIIPVEANLLGDVVLLRKDIGVSYHLAVVMDDAFQGISHVTRGNDLLPSTHVHRLLQALLHFPVPLYFHHPLVLDPTGRRLAKRDSARSLASLRNAGFSPGEILTPLQNPEVLRIMDSISKTTASTNPANG